MKFLRFGSPGLEEPGLLAVDCQIRDISAFAGDFAGNTRSCRALAAFVKAGLGSAPIVAGSPQIEPPLARVANLY